MEAEELFSEMKDVRMQEKKQILKKSPARKLTFSQKLAEEQEKKKALKNRIYFSKANRKEATNSLTRYQFYELILILTTKKYELSG